MTLARLCGVANVLVFDKDVAVQKIVFEEAVNVATAAVMFAPLKLVIFTYDGAFDRLSTCSQQG